MGTSVEADPDVVQRERRWWWWWRLGLGKAWGLVGGSWTLFEGVPHCGTRFS